MEKNKINDVENGAASIKIELKEGNIIVTHGVDKIVLHEVKNAKAGSWKKLWQCIRSIESAKG